MKKWIQGFAMCQSMFCAVPCPWNVWEESAREEMLLCLPLVGLEIGLLWRLLAWLCVLLKLPEMMAALVLCAWPWVITGFLHLDGFMDVTDAVRSYRSPERRREILKDSHVGSFAVIGFGLLLLTQFVCCAELKEETDLNMLIFIPMVSRFCSVLAVKALPPMESSQYSALQRKNRDLWISGGMLLAVLTCGFLTGGRYAAALLGAVAAYGLALRRAYGSLKGMNGDISGYCLSVSEAAALAVLALL